jgi:uncharacterized protein (TIGR03118 family)
MATRILLALLCCAVAMPALAGTVTQTNLTSDGAVPAANTDPNLKNPWGISYGPGGPFWVSDNDTGLTTLYDGAGAVQSLVVTIPPASGTGPGSPTGQVFNGGSEFVVSQGGKSGPAAFLFATEDGTISGWAPSVNFASAIIAVNGTDTRAVFKGIALLTDKAGKSFLLATDFRAGVVDVFDGGFNLVRAFRDPNLPAAYSPYNVAVLSTGIYVTYAVANAQRHDSVSGPGLGVVERVGFDGKILSAYRFGVLDAPWGLAVAPSSWGDLAGDILVGNFGSGTIHAFSASLQPRGALLRPNGAPLEIGGLWGLIPGNGGNAGATSDIYFSAGPHNEANGLFGSLSYTP